MRLATCCWLPLPSSCSWQYPQVLLAQADLSDVRTVSAFQTNLYFYEFRKEHRSTGATERQALVTNPASFYESLFYERQALAAKQQNASSTADVPGLGGIALSAAANNPLPPRQIYCLRIARLICKSPPAPVRRCHPPLTGAGGKWRSNNWEADLRHRGKKRGRQKYKQICRWGRREGRLGRRRGAADSPDDGRRRSSSRRDGMEEHREAGPCEREWSRGRSRENASVRVRSILPSELILESDVFWHLEIPRSTLLSVDT